MLLPYLSLTLAALIWGANTPIMKWALESTPLFSLAFLRFSIATLLILPFTTKKLRIEKEDWPKIILAALFGITFNVVFFFLGVKFTFASNAALIIAAIPIFTIFAAQIFLKEKVKGKLIAAAVLSIIGFALIFGPSVAAFGLNHLFGGIFLILASLFWVGYEIVSKKLFKKYSPQTVTLYSFLIGAFTFLPFFIVELLTSSWTSELKFQGVVGIIYGAIFSSTVAYFAWQWGLSKLKASEASFFFYLDPVSGVIVSIILLGERVSSLFVLGAVLITASLFLAEYHRKNHPIHR